MNLLLNNKNTDDVTALSNKGTTLIISSALMASCGLYIAYRWKKNDKDTKWPPFAPGSVYKHAQACTSAEYPWFLLDAAHQLGSSVFRLKLGLKMFAVGEPTAVRAILTDSSTTKPSLFYKTHENVVGGPTLNTTNGALWHSKRKATAPAFSSKHVKRMIKVAVDKTEVWMKDLLLKEDAVFDVSKEILDIVLSALIETALEYEMTKQERDFFCSEMNLALIEYDQKTAANPLRSLFGFFLPERRRANAAVKNMRDVVLRIMNEYRKKTTTIEGTLIQLIMDSNAFPTDFEKATEITNFLIAGHDTTGYTIAWILICIARNHEVQSKLRVALLSVAPESWSSCEYLKYVIKEGMRLYPVGASIRLLGKDIMTKDNEIIPSGSICMLPFILLFRNPDVFDEPESFLPCRWEHPSSEMVYTINPFGLGKQNCVGQSLAKAEIFSIVAKIISEFDLSVEDDGAVDFFLTIKPVGTMLRARRV